MKIMLLSMVFILMSTCPLHASLEEKGEHTPKQEEKRTPTSLLQRSTVDCEQALHVIKDLKKKGKQYSNQNNQLTREVGSLKENLARAEKELNCQANSYQKVKNQLDDTQNQLHTQQFQLEAATEYAKTLEESNTCLTIITATTLALAALAQNNLCTIL